MRQAWLRKRLELEKMMGADVLPRAEGVEAELGTLEEEVRRCQRCRLYERRTQTVFARGNPRAALMFIGEAPGQEEDRQGLPFVGPAGKLLDKMIFAMGLRPDDVYIGNIIKSRPPENREPRPDEIAACFPFLERQIELVRPHIICTLGRPAANALLGTSLSMGDLRGKWHSYRGIAVLPTYHPAYLLRSPGQKKQAWEDLKKVIFALAEGPPEPAALL
jgi:DNA polymerase